MTRILFAGIILLAFLQACIEDPPEPSVVGFSRSNLTTVSEGNSLPLNIEIDNPQSEDIILLISTTGEAVNGLDFSLSSPTVTIPAGARSASVLVTIIDDSEYEGGSEDMTFEISSVLTNNAVIGNNVASGIITDNELLFELSWTPLPSGSDPDLDLNLYYNDVLGPELYAWSAGTTATETIIIAGSEDPDGEYLLEVEYWAGSFDVEFIVNAGRPDGSTSQFQGSFLSTETGDRITLVQVFKTGGGSNYSLSSASKIGGDTSLA